MGGEEREGQGPANARGQVVMKHFTGPNGCGRIQTTMNPSSANPTRHHTSPATACACATFGLCLVGCDNIRPEMISGLRVENTHLRSLGYHSSSPTLIPLARSVRLLGSLSRPEPHASTTRRFRNWNGVMKVGHSHHERRNKTPQSGGHSWTER